MSIPIYTINLFQIQFTPHNRSKMKKSEHNENKKIDYTILNYYTPINLQITHLQILKIIQIINYLQNETYHNRNPSYHVPRNNAYVLQSKLIKLFSSIYYYTPIVQSNQNKQVQKKTTKEKLKTRNYETKTLKPNLPHATTIKPINFKFKFYSKLYLHLSRNRTKNRKRLPVDPLEIASKSNQSSNLDKLHRSKETRIGNRAPTNQYGEVKQVKQQQRLGLPRLQDQQLLADYYNKVKSRLQRLHNCCDQLCSCRYCTSCSLLFSHASFLASRIR